MERIIGVFFLAALLLTALVLSVKTYNGLIVLRSFSAEGWSGVLAAVRRRRAAIAQVLRAMASSSPEERAPLEMMRSACARDASQWDVGELMRAEAELSASLPSFLALCERSPETSEGSEKNEDRTSIRVLLPELSTEVEMARSYYNATARDYNTRLGQFPANLIGWVFRFREAEYLESDMWNQTCWMRRPPAAAGRFDCEGEGPPPGVGMA